MEVASSLSFTPSHHRLKDSRTSSLPLPVRSYKGHHIRGSSYKQSIFRNAYCSAQNGFLCMPRKHFGVSWPSSYLKKEELDRSRYDNKFLIRKTSPRSNVVRCELAETGTPHSEYPLSEFKLEPKVRGICFYAVTAITAIFLIIPMLVVHPIVLMVDRYRRKFHHFIAKIWATLTVSLFFKIEIEGLENLPPADTPAVYVANHQSFLDIYTLLTLGRNFKFISKTGIFLFPVIGWAMSMMGVIPLKRMDTRSGVDCLIRCRELVKKGASVFFFPEGTRSKDGNLGSFQKGAFSVAAKTRAPVVPMTLMGTGKIMPTGKEGILNLGSVKVIIHKPIQGTNAEQLCNEARKTIAETLCSQG